MSAAPSAQVTFKLRQFRVGDRYNETSTSVSDIDIDMNGKPLKQHQETLKQYDTEVLAVDQGRAIKARIRYRKHLTTHAENGGASASSSGSVENNVYLIERKDGILDIANETGTNVSEAEHNIISGDYEGFGDSSPIDEALTSRPWRIGESLESVAKELGKKLAHDAALASGAKSDPANVEILFSTLERRNDRRVAVLDAKVRSVVNAPTYNFAINLTGQLVVDVDALDSVEQGDSVLSGPIVVSGAASGSGAISIRFKIRDEP